LATYHPSIFFKSKYKTSKEKGYLATDYNTSFASKKEARAEAQRRIKETKMLNPERAKYLNYSAHVATSKKPKGISWF
jgi:hypothetical protein